MQALQRLNPNLMLSWILYGYFFISAIPHTSAARYVLLGLFVLTLIVSLAKKTISLAPTSGIAWLLTVFVATALLSALTSPYLIDSLQGWRKDYLPPLVLILGATGIRFSNEQKINFAKGVLFACVAGFMAKTLLAFWDGAINHPFIFSPYSNSDFFQANGLPKYVAFYAVESTLYLAITLGVLTFIRCNTWLKAAIAATVALSYFIIFVSGIRAAFLVTLLILGIPVLALLKKPKALAALLIGFAVVGSGAYVINKQNTELDRFASVFKSDSYSQAQGMSGRYQTWTGIIEIAESRPLLGFGPGWQKLPEVAQDLGLTEQWRQDGSDYGKTKYYLLTLKRGQVNPHNLAMQLLFETGAAGLVIYAALLLCMLLAVYKLIKKPGQNPATSKAIAIISSAYLLAYLMVDVTNGFLLHNTLVAIIIVIVLAKQCTADQPAEA